MAAAQNPSVLMDENETGELGFEPRLTGSEPVVLPLHHSPRNCGRVVDWPPNPRNHRLRRWRKKPRGHSTRSTGAGRPRSLASSVPADPVRGNSGRCTAAPSAWRASGRPGKDCRRDGLPRSGERGPTLRRKARGGRVCPKAESRPCRAGGSTRALMGPIPNMSATVGGLGFPADVAGDDRL